MCRSIDQIFLDPDAPTSVEPATGPFLHWIWANFRSMDGSDGQTICELKETRNEREECLDDVQLKVNIDVLDLVRRVVDIDTFI